MKYYPACIELTQLQVQRLFVWHCQTVQSQIVVSDQVRQCLITESTNEKCHPATLKMGWSS